nr:hypothetical protein [uncultured bacterium]
MRGRCSRPAPARYDGRSPAQHSVTPACGPAIPTSPRRHEPHPDATRRPGRAPDRPPAALDRRDRQRAAARAVAAGPDGIEAAGGDRAARFGRGRADKGELHRRVGRAGTAHPGQAQPQATEGAQGTRQGGGAPPGGRAQAGDGSEIHRATGGAAGLARQPRAARRRPGAVVRGQPAFDRRTPSRDLDRTPARHARRGHRRRRWSQPWPGQPQRQPAGCRRRALNAGGWLPGRLRPARRAAAAHVDGERHEGTVHPAARHPLPDGLPGRGRAAARIQQVSPAGAGGPGT